MTTRETTVRLTVADNFSTQLRAFATALDQSDKAVQKTSKQMGVFGKANQQLTDGLKGGVTLALASIPAVMGAAGLAAVKLGMDMEQTRVAFTTLTGSAELANEHLQDLRDFAKSTPFQFTELTDASKKMQAFGFATKDVIPMMTDIGDAVSALGAGSEGIDSVVRALGQMQAKGKVSAEEMNQLTEVGISGWKYLAEGMGKTTAEVMKLSEKGLIPAGDAIQYLLKGMREDFGGGMAAQSKTAAGQLSNLTDTLEEMGATIGEILLPAVKDVIKVLSDFFGLMKEGIKTGDMLINWSKKMTEAYTATDKKIRETSKSYEEYIRNTLLTAEAAGLLTSSQGHLIETGKASQQQIDFMTESVGAMTESEWAADHALQSRNATTQAYVKELGARMAGEQAVTEALQNQSAIMSPTELGMLALAEASRQGGDAQKDFAKWTEAGIESADKARLAAAKSTEGYYQLAESLKGASEATLAKRAIDDLGASLEAGTISPEKYGEAVRKIQLAYGLATEQSIAMNEAMIILQEAYSSGTITSTQYSDSLTKVDEVSKDGKVSLNEFGFAVQFSDEAAMNANPRLQEMGVTHLPKIKESATGTKSALDLMKGSTDNSAEAMNVAAQRASNFRLELIKLAAQIDKMPSYVPQGAGGGPQARAMGGPVLPGRTYIVGENGPETLVMGAKGGMVIPNQNNNYYNMNVYTQDAASPIREFGLMRALAGA